MRRFVASLYLTIRVLLGALAVLVVAWSSYAVVVSGELGSVALLSVVWALTTFLGVRLGRGDVVYIDASLGLAALVLFPIQVVLAAAGIGCAVGVFGNSRDHSESTQRMSEVGRKLVLLLALAPLARIVATYYSESDVGPIVQAGLLLFGLLYAVVDLVTKSLVNSIRSGGNLLDELVRLVRPIAVIYLGHISTGVVMVLLYGSMGYVGLIVMIALVLMMQNSFNLLLKIRTAYQETMQALVLAAEMQIPGERGHARRVADLAGSAARLLGVRGVELEHIGYGALLHDIGKIGLESDGYGAPLRTHAELGADIVREIPFVAPVAPIVLHHEDPVASIGLLPEPLQTATLLVKGASRVDRLASDGGRAPDEDEVFQALHDMCTSAETKRVVSAIVEAGRGEWPTVAPPTRGCDD